MSDTLPITIFHNPRCGTSRKAVAMIEVAGYAPTVIEYVKAGWTLAQPRDLFARMGATARQMMREKGTPAAELGLTNPSVSQDEILAAMVAHPILVNRPIVVTPRGAKLCRPSEVVLDLLERRPEAFTKEDGGVILSK